MEVWRSENQLFTLHHQTQFYFSLNSFTLSFTYSYSNIWFTCYVPQKWSGRFYYLGTIRTVNEKWPLQILRKYGTIWLHKCWLLCCTTCASISDLIYSVTTFQVIPILNLAVLTLISPQFTWLYLLYVSYFCSSV